MYQHFHKTLIERCIAIILVIILAPMIVVIFLVLLISLGEFPLFFQERVGYKNNIFKVMKFKTMLSSKELQNDQDRMTKTSKFIRSMSLDELPQLINVIVGDMSLVGPRPLLAEYLNVYTEEELHRHDVRPGITGWAQINGRNSLTWKERFTLDLYYTKNISFLFDLKILIATLKKVLFRESVNSSENITMEKYNGSN